MKKYFLAAAFVAVGIVIGALSSNSPSGSATAQFAPPSAQSGDALWAPTQVWRTGLVFACQQRPCKGL